VKIIDQDHGNFCNFCLFVVLKKYGPKYKSLVRYIMLKIHLALPVCYHYIRITLLYRLHTKQQWYVI
jgi:hypothetical protein